MYFINICIQNSLTGFGLLKSSKHFLISISFRHSPLFMTIHAPPLLPPDPGSATGILANYHQYCFPWVEKQSNSGSIRHYIRCPSPDKLSLCCSRSLLSAPKTSAADNLVNKIPFIYFWTNMCFSQLAFKNVHCFCIFSQLFKMCFFHWFFSADHRFSTPLFFFRT